MIELRTREWSSISPEGDSRLKGILFDYYVGGPGLGAAYRELGGEKSGDGS